MPFWACNADNRPTSTSHLVRDYKPECESSAPSDSIIANTGHLRPCFGTLQHRESGIRDVGAILFGESTLMSFYKSSSGLPMLVFVALLVMLGRAAPAFTWLAIRSCRRSFGAAIENAVMMAKVAWAMGAAQVVISDQCGADFPAGKDASPYAPRWLSDCHKSQTTDAFQGRSPGQPK